MSTTNNEITKENEVQNKTISPKEITDTVCIREFESGDVIYTGGMCPTCTDTRESYGYNQAKYGKYNNMINCMSDKNNKITIEVHNRRNNQGQLVHFIVNDEEHNAFIDWSQEPYKIQFDGPIEDDYAFLPIATTIMEGNTELKEAFTKMCDETLPIAERIEAAGVACDAFKIESDEIDEVDITYDELTPEMAHIFLETGEFGNNDKPIAEYGTSTGFDIEKAKNGEYRKILENYPWSEEAKKKIPSLAKLEKYVTIEDFNKIFQKVSIQLESAQELKEELDKGLMEQDEYDEELKDIMTNILLYGKPGSGKTETCKAIAATFGLPLWEITVSQYTEEGTFWGENTVKDGVVDIDDGPVLKGFAEGGIVVINEINLPQPGVVQGALAPATDGTNVIRRGNGSDEVHRNPLTIMMATMNVGLKGTRQMNEAVASRFWSVPVEEMDKETFIEALSKHTKTSKENLDYIYESYQKIQNYLNETSREKIALNNITFRHCVEAAKFMNPRFGLPKKQAVKDGLLNHLNQYEPGLTDQVYEAVLENTMD